MPPKPPSAQQPAIRPHVASDHRHGHQTGRGRRPEDAGNANWLYGWHAVSAALVNPRRKLGRLLATAEAAEVLAADALLTATGIAPEIVDRDSLARLLPPGAVHQGLALATAPLAAPAFEDLLDDAGDKAILLCLDQVTDPQNIGAILRSSAVFGALAVVLPDRHAPDITGALAKAASGAVEAVPLVRVVNLSRSLDLAKRAGFWCIGLDGEAEQTLAEVAPTGKVALVMGAEGEGLRRLTREHCDAMARLPTPGPLRSLNVSVAAAVALYELVRAG